MPENYQIPQAITSKILKDVLVEMKFEAPVDTGAGIRSFTGDAGEGWITLRGKTYMLIFQNSGTKPHTQWELAGKRIPMRDAAGNIHFVYCNPDKIGKPGKINMRDPRTGRILPGNTGVKWRHPGLKPKHFIEDSIVVSVQKHANEIAQDYLNWQLKTNL